MHGARRTLRFSNLDVQYYYGYLASHSSVYFYKSNYCLGTNFAHHFFASDVKRPHDMFIFQD